MVSMHHSDIAFNIALLITGVRIELRVQEGVWLPVVLGNMPLSMSASHKHEGRCVRFAADTMLVVMHVTSLSLQ